MFSQEVVLGSPAVFSCNVTWNYHCELLIWELPAEEEQVVVCLFVKPGGINPSINPGHLTQVILCIEYGDCLNPVSIIVAIVITGIPAVKVAVHAPCPEDISVGGVVEYPVTIYVCIMVIVNIDFPGRVGIVIKIPPVIPAAPVPGGFDGCSVVLI